ncbi:MAG: DUF6951 family protein [Anaerolineae bacterium]
MAQVGVKSGVCGFETRIQAESDDSYVVDLHITSDCALVGKLAQVLKQVSAFHEVGSPISDTETYQAASRCKLHAACPVPCGILKAVEVAAGLALPVDVQITIRAV